MSASIAPSTSTLETTAVAVLDPPETESPQVSPLNLELEAELEAHAQTVPQMVATVAAPADDNLDTLRTAVADALTAGGHATAATIIEDGQWTIDGSSVRIAVNAKPTMIRLTFNPAAEKIIRQALTEAAVPSRFMIVPGENTGTAGNSAKKRAPQGSVDAEARAHPLVIQAQSLFDAEIVTVVDLRT